MDPEKLNSSSLFIIIIHRKILTSFRVVLHIEDSYQKSENEPVNMVPKRVIHDQSGSFDDMIRDLAEQCSIPC